MNHKSIFILGRQPAIGRAELESLFGANHLEPISDIAIACDIDPANIPFERIGGSMRLAKPLAVVPSLKWADISRVITKQLTASLEGITEGSKVKLGYSVFGLDIDPQELLRTGLTAKKAIKATGRSVRIVPNTEAALNSAQVLHNGLTGEAGREIVCIQSADVTYIAQTIAIQNIDAYARRDQERPKRDTFVGMLPPKLAQIIVNLAIGNMPPSLDKIILDPFCGTGVVLQEALLMGYSAYGSDVETRMVDYTRQNLEWLATHGVESTPQLEVGDATTHTWEHPFTAVACETYLGRPLSGWPKPDKLHEIIGTCNVIIQKYLKNMAAQVPAGTRLCLAVPAWQSPSGRLHHLPLLDQLEVMGYNRVSFSWATTTEMVYCRPDQLVARELLVIVRK